MAEQEVHPSSRERVTDVEQFGEIAHERHEAIRNAIERAERKQKTHSSEREVLAEAQKLASEVEDAARNKQVTPRVEKHRGPLGKKQLDVSFKAQMKSAQADMGTLQRATSSFMHNKLIEKTSDIIGSTVARPNAMLSGSIAAFISITVIYFVSKHYGFQLTGFETIGAFAIGWILGLLYDYTTVMIRGGRK